MPQIYGTQGSETIYGTADPEQIYGLNGDDIIYGGDGPELNDDLIKGGLGNDLIYGGAGGDTIYDEYGDDTVYAGLGGDLVYGSAGNDHYDGGAGYDSLNYFDALAGVLIDMTLTTGQVRSIKPNDAAFVGVDTFTNFEYIGGSKFDDIIIGDGASTRFWGADGNDTIRGGAGDDELLGGLGNDFLDGGDGYDIAWYAGVVAGVTVSLAITGEQNTGHGLDTLINIEGITGTYYDDVLTGNDAANRLYGEPGNDRIDGGGGDDVIDGGPGIDILTGGAGADTFMMNEYSGDTIADFGAGDRLLFQYRPVSLSFSNGVLTAGAGSVTLTGVNNVSLAVTPLADGAVAIALGGPPLISGATVAPAASASAETGQPKSPTMQQYVGGSGDDVLTGTESYDELYGFGGDDTLHGLAGSDYINGGTGADLMAGGADNDQYVVDDIGDQVIELSGGGVDMVFSSIAYVLPDNVENLSLSGSADLTGKGNALNNNLSGNAGANLLDGKQGADTMVGGAGDDVYIVDSSGDIVGEFPGEGSDSVYASVSFSLMPEIETLFLTGEAAIDGTGNDTANRIVGNAGSNTLSGRLGDDILTGGAGDDLFLDSMAHHNGDTVTDFTRGDRLIFSDAPQWLSFKLSGDVLSYGVGSLKLPNLQMVSLAVHTASGGGLELAFGGPALVAAATSVPATSAAADPFGF